MKATVPPPVPDEIIARIRTILEGGASREEAIREMRREGLHIIECIKLVRSLYGLSLGEAKEIVHASEAWSDRRESYENFHEAVIDSLKQSGWTVEEPKALTTKVSTTAA